MKSNPPALDDSSSIPFKEFRDEEIAGFFANESRTFHPVLSASDDDFGRLRLVGTPHFSSQRKGTAAFRTVAHQEKSVPQKTVQTIPLTEKLFDVPPKNSSGTLIFRRDCQENADYPSVIMPFGKAAEEENIRDSGSSVSETEPADERLTRLTESWSQLPEPIKETITALLDTVRL